MKFEDSSRQIGFRNLVSRRGFIKSTAAFATVLAASTKVEGFVVQERRRTLAYVGTATDPGDSPGNGQGIYLFEMNPATGELSLIKLAAKCANPTWITLHPSGKYLYAIDEVSNFDGKNGSVSAFAIDRTNGDLQFLNAVSSQGRGPAHMSLDATGRYVFVANYAGGSIAVLPILANGSLASAVDAHQDKGYLGSIHAASAPRGSFAISGHDAPHAHMIHPDPQNRFVVQTDLGQDRIYVYKFDVHTGKLTPADSPFVTLPGGDGPRHFAFHPNGEWMYSVQEEASTVAFFLYDSRTGGLRPQQTVSTLPNGYTGTSFGSEIMLSPDGRFLYAANRLYNSIAVFSVGANGHLTQLAQTMTHGDYPRHFNLDPQGNFLYACNQRSDQITSFRVNKATGLLTFTGMYTPVGSPACIVFLPIT